MRFLAFIFVSLLLVTGSNAQDSPVSLPAVASAFNVPEDSLRLSDKTEEVARKHEGNIVSAFLVDSANGRFPSIQILVTKGRFLLSEQLEEKFVQQTEGVVTTSLPDGSPAYISVEGVGPGGEGHVGLAHLKALDLDLKVKVTITNDDPRMAELGGGVREVLASRDALNAAITSMMVSASNVLAKNLAKVAEVETPPSQKAPSAPVEREPEAAAGLNSAKSVTPAQKAESSEAKGAISWLLVLGVAVLSLAVWKIFFSKKS